MNTGRNKYVKRALIFCALLLMLIPITGCAKGNPGEITAFVGSASKPAMEEASQAFEKETGIKVYLNFGGSGTMLSQMKISRGGDLYIPGSPDYMLIAERDGVVDSETVKIISYLVPAILVQKGNPKNISALVDLAKPGIEVGIGNPKAVCVGLYAVEVLDSNKLLEEVGNNIVTYAESCSKTASLISLKSVDAILGWRVFSYWRPDMIDVVYLSPEQVSRLAYIPAAISKFTESRENAGKFIEFLVSPQGQRIFSKWGYITTEDEVRKYAPDAEIGGEYTLPDSYEPLVK